MAYLQEVYSQDDQYVAKLETIEDALNPQTLRKILLYHSCQALKKIGNKMTEGISDGINPK